MGTGSALMDGVGTLVSFLFSIVGAGLGLDGLSALYTAYKRACMRLDDERWLLENCREPLFFSKMRAHTTVCSEVEANARVGAFWTALREVTDAFKITWQPCLTGIALSLVVLLPVFWICMARASARLGPTRWDGIPRHERHDFPKCKEAIL